MIDGKLVKLRAYHVGDLDYLADLRNDLGLQEMLMALPRPNSIEKVRSWVNGKTEQDDAVFFIIAEMSSDKAVGFVQVTEVNMLHGSGWLGIGLGSDFQKKGFGREATVLLEDYLKRIFKLRKLLLQVEGTNKPAQSFYLSQGYREIGVYKEHYYLNGGYRDVVLMEKFL